MARTGDVIENPVTGERVVFRQMSRETNGALLQFDLFLKPKGFVPITHIHSRQEERVEVVSGRARYRLGSQEIDLPVGEAAVLPPGIPHTLWNSADEETHLLVEVRPALKMELALETLFGLARAGKTNKRGSPNPLQGVLLAREYEVFLSAPPVPVQRAAAAVLAPLARFLGYRALYPEYSGPE